LLGLWGDWYSLRFSEKFVLQGIRAWSKHLFVTLWASFSVSLPTCKRWTCSLHLRVCSLRIVGTGSWKVFLGLP
jgi:hypothetical protein